MIKLIVGFILGFCIAKYGFQNTINATANTTSKVIETSAKGINKTAEVVDKGIETGKKIKE
jgi:hypothetical protein